jgi:Na+-driven multidrug efflux pump
MGDMKKAKETDTKLIAFSLSCSVVTAVLLALLTPALVHTYKVTSQVQDLAVSFLYVVAATQTIRAFVHACYFTLRSGGRTVITFLFDSVFVWVISVPAAYMLTRYTGLHIIPIYVIVQLLDILKGIVGFILVRKGVWLRNIVADA